MHAIWVITKRELGSFFDSLIAYIMLILFLGFSGFFTWLFGGDIFLVGQASLEAFFNVAYWSLFFFIPALTMRLIAEERKTGTIELLLTKAVTDRQLVTGKFLSTFLLVCIALAFTLPYLITVANIGNIDLGQALCGYAGLLLMSAAYISIGLYASSITSNQIVAFLAALFIGLFFHIIFDVLSGNFTGWPGELFSALSLSNHFESISRGVVDSRDVIYFLSITLIGIFLSEVTLTKRNLDQTSAKLRQKIYTSTLLIIGIIVAVNLVSTEFHVRLDLTEDRQYTLSPATRDILENLEDPVTVKAYFSKDLPPNIGRARKDFQDMLVEYANISDGMIAYEFINPNENEVNETEALNSGIRPVLIDVREKDQMKQQKAFLGATVSLGDKQEAIPFLGPGAAMEYELSTAIRKLAVSEKPAIGFLQGHGEAPLSEMMEASEQLSILYQTRDVTFTDSSGVPSDIKTLAIIRPQDSIPATHLGYLDGFLARGGRLFVAINRVNANLQSAFGFAVNTGLEAWLQEKGLQVEDSFVIDAQCGSVSVPQRMGPFTIQTNVSFPFVPVIGNFADHPVTSGLEAMLLEFASPVNYTGDSTKKYTPIAFSSEKSNALKAPQYFDIHKEWTEDDFQGQRISVAAALEGAISGTGDSKIIVITDGDFVVNGPAQQARRQQPDNISFLSNSIDWLSDDTGLISLRTKGAVYRPIEQLEDSTKSFIKYSNFLLPILLVIGYGIYRAQRNRITRLKRMGENYEAA